MIADRFEEAEEEQLPYLGKRDLAKQMMTYAADKLAELNMVGRWLATTPQPVVRAMLGRQVWDLSRLYQYFETRGRELQGKPDRHYQSEHFAHALQIAADASTTLQRISALHCLIFRYELRIYQRHVEVTEPVTEWYLQQVIREQTELTKWGEAVVAGLVTNQALWGEVQDVQDRIRPLLERDARERPQPGRNFSFDYFDVPNVRLGLEAQTVPEGTPLP
jgi:hypothetical protein